MKLTLTGPLVLALASQVGCGPSNASDDLNQLGHLVVIYLENHSFDNLYAGFGGADALMSTSGARPQIDMAGQTYAALPQPMDTNSKPAVPDARFPATLPNRPFDITQYVPANQKIPDLVHRYYHEQMQIDAGKMDRFAAVSDAKGLVMGYYPTAGLPLAQLASQYTICDRFFHGAFGGSFLNHIWLIAAAAPTFPSAPASIVAKLDGMGGLVTDGIVTPDGFAVNTAYSVNTPHPATTPRENLVPNQTLPTIGDLLTAKGLSWAWYSGGWKDAVAGNPDPEFQFHHQPFIYFDKYKDGSPDRAAHLKDETDFLAAVQAGKLPTVAFVKPLGENNEHPGYTDLVTGENHVVDLVHAIQQSPSWHNTAIIITYDENGGFWDHVAPPTRDKWGPGTRVPTIVISPYAKKHHVDHTSYDTTSILALIEHRWGLPSLGKADAAAPDLSPAFDFSQEP
jgi:phospholipase C